MSKYLKTTVMIIAFSSIVIGAVLGKSYYDKQKTQQQFEQLIKTAQEKKQHVGFSRTKSEEENFNLDILYSAQFFKDTRGKNLRWLFDKNAPPAFAGKSLLLNRDSCYTTIDMNSNDCHHINEKQLQQILLAQKKYDASVKNNETERKLALEKAKDNKPCDDWLAQLPNDYEVFHLTPIVAPERGFKDLDYQIKGSDDPSPAYLMDVEVNYNKKPVVLILDYHYSTVWRIHYSPDTHIAGVWATGYSHQAVVGVDSSTHVLQTSYNQPRCKSHRKKTHALPKLKKTVAPQDVVDSHTRIGRYTDNLISHGDINTLRKDPAEFRLAGKLGVEQLVNEGKIRQMTTGELAQISKRQGKPFKYKYTDPNEPFTGSYIIEEPITFPANMNGGYSSYFYLLDDNTPFPEGDVGHNTIILASGFCIGVCA